MRLLVVDEYVTRHAWTPGRWTRAIARSLDERGHDVTVLLDGLEDVDCFGRARLDVRRPIRHRLARDPLAFATWVRRTTGDLRPDATLSLTWLAEGDVWAPLGERTIDEVKRIWTTSNPLSAALETAHRPWLIGALRAETVALRRGGKIATLASVSSGTWKDCERLGPASTLEPPPPDESGSLRARVRSMLSVAQGQRVLLCSGVHLNRPGLLPMMRGLRRVRHGWSGDTPPPVLVVFGDMPHAIVGVARRAGVGAGVRAMGTTERMDAALCACDLAVAPLGGTGGGASGRFIADALRMGRPVVCDAHAPGAELVEPRAFGTNAVGRVVEERDSVAWAIALGDVLEDEKLAEAARAAGRVGPALSFDVMMDRLEKLLEKAARRVR